MPKRASVLLVDDDARLGTLLSEYFGRNEVDLTTAADGERGLAQLKDRRFDAVLLDVMMPGIDGLEVLKRIRADARLARVPVLMLTAKGDDVDRIVGLEIGADDYVPKPFNPRELLARVRAVLRRATAPADPEEKYQTGELVIDFGARTVTVEGKRAALTGFEFELLAALARAAGRVLSRDQLMDMLKGQELDAFDRSIDVHVSRLRAKIEKDPRAPRYVQTVRGAGYVLAREEPR
ncbi:MAG TPA: response regulator [bacterium]|nr:response regulator [bacterium]